MVMNNDLELLKQMLGDLLHDAAAQTIEDGDFAHVATSVIPEDIDMMVRVYNFCKKPRVFSVARYTVNKDGVTDDDMHLFFDYNDAVVFFDMTVKDAKENAHEYGRDGWHEELGSMGETKWYETSPDGTKDGENFGCYLMSRIVN